VTPLERLRALCIALPEVTAQTNPLEHSVVYRYRVEFDKVIDPDDPPRGRRGPGSAPDSDGPHRVSYFAPGDTLLERHPVFRCHPYGRSLWSRAVWRRPVLAVRTAWPMALREPTSTTSFWARVMAV
jgi:hypothetical protein